MDVDRAHQCIRELCRHVLLVEDSILIALDAEVLVTDLGAERVSIAASVLEALRSLENAPPTLAILDVKLEGETCFPIADKLQEKQIPYAFATGYSDKATFPDRHKLAPCMTKPYNEQALRRVIEELIGGADQCGIQRLQQTG
ncbi:MAG: response regulator [Alphaproteobacteria bacterium]|nr:response regulator [Alphaproteobacteria bacterium]